MQSIQSTLALRSCRRAIDIHFLYDNFTCSLDALMSEINFSFFVIVTRSCTSYSDKDRRGESISNIEVVNVEEKNNSLILIRQWPNLYQNQTNFCFDYV